MTISINSIPSSVIVFHYTQAVARNTQQKYTTGMAASEPSTAPPVPGIGCGADDTCRTSLPQDWRVQPVPSYSRQAGSV
jgi:hypothetical protein